MHTFQELIILIEHYCFLSVRGNHYHGKMRWVSVQVWRLANWRL